MAQVLPLGVYDRLLNPGLYPNTASWDRHYWVGGRSLQSAELNEIETLLFNSQARLGQTLFTEGSVLSGCSVIATPIPADVVILQSDVSNAAVAITGHSVASTTIDLWNQYYRYAAFHKGYLTSLNDNRLDYLYSSPSVGSNIVDLDTYFIDRSEQGINISSSVNVSITSGVMFISGKLRDIPSSTSILSLTGYGNEYVGIRVIETIITPATDATLLDPSIAPTVGASQYNLKGAYRRVLTFEWTANDAGSIPVFRFNNGNLLNSSNSGNNSSLIQLLARQTYDREGNFSVSGLAASVRVNQNDGSKLDLTIDPGKAYVQGVEITKTSPIKFLIDKAIDTSNVQDEQQQFQTGSFLYGLSSTPVADVSSVIAPVSRAGVPVVKGANNTPDNLVTQSIPVLTNIQGLYSVAFVGNEPGTSDYTQGSDYKVVGNTISWMGLQPSEGVTYYVNLVYLKLLVPGVKDASAANNESVA